MKTLFPSKNRLVLSVIKPSDELINGIIVSIKSRSYEIGEVKGVSCNSLYKIGDIVYIETNAGINIRFEEDNYRVVKEEDIIAIEREENYNYYSKPISSTSGSVTYNEED